MTDDKKQKAKDEFSSIVNAEVDQMFDKPFSKEEEGAVVVQEASELLSKITTMNEINSDLVEDTAEALKQLDASERGVGDLKRIIEIKDELDQAA